MVELLTIINKATILKIYYCQQHTKMMGDFNVGQLIIKRDKALLGCAAKINCYVNGQLICVLRNGDESICNVNCDTVSFTCNLTTNSTMSDGFHIDTSGANPIYINVKAGMQKPQVVVYNSRGSVVNNSSMAIAQKQELAVFTPTQVVGNYFGINESTRQWAVGKGAISPFKKAVPHSYDDIVDFELIEDGTSITKGGLGRAAVGGLLFGGVGALVGATTGGKKAHQQCTNLMVKITVNNMGAPTEYIKLITGAIDKFSPIYKESFQQAQQIISILQLICSQRDTKTSTDKSAINVQELSPADEIRKFKALLNEGVITEKEFQEKKKQLLGL